MFWIQSPPSAWSFFALRYFPKAESSLRSDSMEAMRRPYSGIPAFSEASRSSDSRHPLRNAASGNISDSSSRRYFDALSPFRALTNTLRTDCLSSFVSSFLARSSSAFLDPFFLLMNFRPSTIFASFWGRHDAKVSSIGSSPSTSSRRILQ